jgi:aminoglycoside phosphotransferase family enzyme
MIQIAEKLAAFHKSADIPRETPDINTMKSDFADLENYNDLIRSRYVDHGAQCISEAVTKATAFLDTHATRNVERHAMGFVRDGHGDLHSKNIFLLDQPVIFDCLEFNAHLRHVDVLDELAFFCLDLELFGAKDLSKTFLEHYLSLNPCVQSSEDSLLFRYFQLYRAGVKLKINLIKASDPAKPEEHEQRWKKADEYFAIFQQYLAALNDNIDSKLEH